MRAPGADIANLLSQSISRGKGHCWRLTSPDGMRWEVVRTSLLRHPFMIDHQLTTPIIPFPSFFPITTNLHRPDLALASNIRDPSLLPIPAHQRSAEVDRDGACCTKCPISRPPAYMSQQVVAIERRHIAKMVLTLRWGVGLRCWPMTCQQWVAQKGGGPFVLGHVECCCSARGYSARGYDGFLRALNAGFWGIVRDLTHWNFAWLAVGYLSSFQERCTLPDLCAVSKARDRRMLSVGRKEVAQRVPFQQAR